MSFTSCSIGNPTPCCDGATVAGEVSNQKFVSTDSFLTETNPTILTLKLVGSEHIVTVKDTKNQFCGACGYKGKFGDNFCRKCGHKL
jgi:NADH pyrophosphatase NudC (nudix superfamily)